MQIEFGYAHAGHIAGEFTKIAERNPTSYTNMAGNGGSWPTKLTEINLDPRQMEDLSEIGYVALEDLSSPRNAASWQL